MFYFVRQWLREPVDRCVRFAAAARCGPWAISYGPLAKSLGRWALADSCYQPTALRQVRRRRIVNLILVDRGWSTENSAKCWAGRRN